MLLSHTIYVDYRCFVMHGELCIICVKQSLSGRLSSPWVFHLIKSLSVTILTLTSHCSSQRERFRYIAVQWRLLFSFYVLPDRRLTSYFQPHYSPVTPGQSEKSIIVKAYCVCQNPRLVMYSAESFSPKCECLIISKTL